MITFKYNNKIWKPKNPEKKLRQLGITWDDVEIIEEETKEVKKDIEYQDIKLYYFINEKTGESISSIYPELRDYPVNANDYEPISREDLERRITERSNRVLQREM